MNKALSLLLCCILSCTAASAQGGDARAYIEKGVRMHDEGDFDGALSAYRQALKIEPNSALINYEIANTYFAQKNYAKSLEHLDKVSALSKDYNRQVYIIKGSIYDLQGSPKEAIKVYKQGIKEFPKDYLLNYNLALTLHSNDVNTREIEQLLQDAVSTNPTHASSHLLLSTVLDKQGKRIPALLCLYNFLLLEPTGQRANGGYAMLQDLLSHGVSRTSDTSISIMVNADDPSDPFQAADLMLSIMSAAKVGEKDKNKTEIALLVESIDILIDLLGKDIKRSNFYSRYYVTFFSDMKKKNHLETMCYYISQSNRKDKTVAQWLESNSARVNAMAGWYDAYKR